MKYIKIAMLVIILIIIIVGIILLINVQTPKDDNEVTNSEYINNNNEITNTNITDFELIKIYFEDYKYKAINDPEEAFNLIDMEYREKKFNNDINLYKEYIQNNIDRLQDANVVKHGVTKKDGYTIYIFIDNYNNYYELKETGIYEYTIILDNYTLETDELKKKYSKLTNEEKAMSNMDKVLKLINTKDYSTVYQYLNKEFKNTNFPTLELFSKYIQENFFDNNVIGNISIQSEGNIYILTVPYKESLSSAAEEMEKKFIIKLGEGTNFELSFEV